MLRRLVSTNTVEFKKPPTPEASETAAPIEPALPATGSESAPEQPAGKNGSGLIEANRSAAAIPTRERPENGAAAENSGFANRAVTSDNS